MSKLTGCKYFLKYQEKEVHINIFSVSDIKIK